MIKANDILQSITLTLNAEYSNNNIYTSRELVEFGDFFVELDNVRTTKRFYNQNRSVTARIYYKASTEKYYEQELYQVCEELEDLFYLKLDVLDRHLNTSDFISRIIEDTLYFSFTVEYFDSDFTETGEDIENLILGGI
jgi:hypothetical protein